MDTLQSKTDSMVKIQKIMLKSALRTVSYMSVFTKRNGNGELIVTNEGTLIRAFEAIDNAKAELFQAGQVASNSEGSN